MKKLLLLSAILIIISCENDNTIDLKTEEIEGTLPKVSLLNNRLLFDGKESLKNFIETHKGNNFDEEVRKMYVKGFKPLIKTHC